MTDVNREKLARKFLGIPPEAGEPSSPSAPVTNVPPDPAQGAPSPEEAAANARAEREQLARGFFSGLNQNAINRAHPRR